MLVRKVQQTKLMLRQIKIKLNSILFYFKVLASLNSFIAMDRVGSLNQSSVNTYTGTDWEHFSLEGADGVESRETLVDFSNKESVNSEHEKLIEERIAEMGLSKEEFYNMMGTNKIEDIIDLDELDYGLDDGIDDGIDYDSIFSQDIYRNEQKDMEEVAKHTNMFDSNVYVPEKEDSNRQLRIQFNYIAELEDRKKSGKYNEKDIDEEIRLMWQMVGRKFDDELENINSNEANSADSDSDKENDYDKPDKGENPKKIELDKPNEQLIDSDSFEDVILDETPDDDSEVSSDLEDKKSIEELDETELKRLWEEDDDLYSHFL